MGRTLASSLALVGVIIASTGAGRLHAMEAPRGGGPDAPVVGHGGHDSDDCATCGLLALPPACLTETLSSRLPGDLPLTAASPGGEIAPFLHVGSVPSRAPPGFRSLPGD